MAELIKLGSSENESERWAAKYLRDNLPDNYLIFSNIYINYNGTPFEIDLVVKGPATIHFIDVKGFHGIVHAGQGSWVLEDGDNERTYPDPVDKVIKHSKKFPGLWRREYRSVKCPFFNGLVLVTGKKGEELDLRKDSQFEAYSAEDTIAELLRSNEYFSSKGNMSSRQEDVLIRLLNLSKALVAPIMLGDYKITSVKELAQGISLQRGEYALGSLSQTFLLKVIDLAQLTETESTELMDFLKKQFRIYLALRGVSGIPRYQYPVLDKAQQKFFLAMEYSERKSIESIKEDLSFVEKCTVFKKIVDILNAAHKRDIRHTKLSLKTIFLTENGSVELDGFQGFSVESSKNSYSDKLQEDLILDLKDFIHCMASLFNSPSTLNELECIVEWPDELISEFSCIDKWSKEVYEGNCSSFDLLLSGNGNEDNVQNSEVDFVVEPGATINNLYELKECIGEGSMGEVWEARHLLGDTKCCIKIMTMPRQSFQVAQKEFQVLYKLFHENIVRIYEFGKVNDSDLYFLVMGMGDESLQDVIKSGVPVNGETMFEWFKGLISALEYLRHPQVGIVHKDIKPANIVVSGQKASLIDFNLSQEDSYAVGTIPFKRPDIGPWGVDWNSDGDLYGLCLSFYVLFHGYPFKDYLPEYLELDSSCPNLFPVKTYKSILKVLNGTYPQPSISLKEWFSITQFKFTLDEPLPKPLLKLWDINNRDDAIILSVLLRNEGKMSKNKLLRDSHKWGNRQEKLLKARLSNLRDTQGLIDFPRGRQKKGARVTVTVAEKLLKEFKEHC